MNITCENTNLQYLGFLATPLLWNTDSVYQLNQFDIETIVTDYPNQVSKNLMIGKRVELFLFHQLTFQKHNMSTYNEVS